MVFRVLSILHDIGYLKKKKQSKKTKQNQDYLHYIIRNISDPIILDPIILE